MIPKKALLICLPIALAGGGVAFEASRRIERLKGELAGLEATAQSEGALFRQTLQGAHVERQLQAFDARRKIAVDLTAARRDRFLGIFGIALSVLGAAAASVLKRIGDELEEHRRMLHGDDGPPPA